MNPQRILKTLYTRRLLRNRSIILLDALAKYSNITDADDVAMIKTFYDMFVEKAPFEKFVETLALLLRDLERSQIRLLLHVPYKEMSV